MHAYIRTGVGFAIPIDMAKNIIDQLIKYGEVQRAVLGISYLQRLPSTVESIRTGLPNITSGVIVLDVPEGSPCGRAGMVAAKRPLVEGAKAVVGDVIVGINGFAVKGPADLNVVSWYIYI
jgi:S1-C subfamily serine protease